MNILKKWNILLMFTFLVTTVLTTTSCSKDETEPVQAVFRDIVYGDKTYHVGIAGAVDLGLSVKWAAYNVGASSYTSRGDLFAWGEVTPYYAEGHAQDEYCENWREGKEDGYDWTSYFDSVDGSDRAFRKYGVGKKMQLELKDDAAHVNWGKPWRMPTQSECLELLEKCEWVYVVLDDGKIGIHGRLVVGPNGNSIFLPDNMNRYKTRFIGDENWRYLSNTLCDKDSGWALGIYFGFYVNKEWCYIKRCYGCSVRPVCK